ncbi:hypothetical protein L0U88_12335 [Flavihumibacter sp. RY-1]|uniref:ABC transmembrane type-1 domain-containing protein n=1 Tax=Flavihumibacter fluminis TaxID=2909236 RepID=A0ABS9BIJ4_9BACT|nr:ABC transporter transmembrane domain-containing protein [Flavihumibacter fluminis]MCF1715415.1 hypothetical protein [Flavihumibacter fluminis]
MQTNPIWWAFIKQHKKETVALLLSSLLASYFALIVPLSIGKYMEIVFSAGGGKTKALELLGIDLPENLVSFFIFFFSLLLIRFLLSWLHQYQSACLGEGFVRQLRSQLFAVHLEERQQRQQPTASSILAYSSEAKNMQHWLVKGVIGLTKDLLFLAMALYVLYSLNAVLTVTVLLSVIVFYLIQRQYSQTHKNVWEEKRKRQGSLLNHVSKTLFEETTQSTGDPEKKYSAKEAKLMTILHSYHFHKSFLRALTPFLLYLMLAIVMIILSWDAAKSNLSAGDVLAYMLVLMNLFPTMRNIIKVEQIWLQGELAAKKFTGLTLSQEISAV